MDSSFAERKYIENTIHIQMKNMAAVVNYLRSNGERTN
jgi:hypothetical protein